MSTRMFQSKVPSRPCYTYLTSSTYSITHNAAPDDPSERISRKVFPECQERRRIIYAIKAFATADLGNGSLAVLPVALNVW